MIHTIDCEYTERAGVAAAYLVVEGDEAAFVETNTSLAVPRLLATLEQAGVGPEQVRYIVITHVHLDHAGGAGLLMRRCPNATLLAHPKAAVHVVDPARIIAGAKQVYGGERFADLYGEIVPVAEDRVRIMADGEQLRWGSRTWTFLHTRGHANHHFVLHDDVADAVFTGDAFGIHYPDAQVKGPFAFPSTTPTDFDPEAAHASLDRIVATGAARVFPTHFGQHTDLAGLAAQMHPMITAHAGIVAQADASGIEGEALDLFCLERVTALFDTELLARGLSDNAHVRSLVFFDVALNAQGLAFAVRKLRYKRSRE